MSLKQNGKKIKLFYAGLLFMAISLSGALILQIILLNFKYNVRDGPIDIVKSQKVLDIDEVKDKNTQKTFYIAASKGGTKYYYQNCAGLNRIKAENLVFFASEGLAEKAGYTLAKNCKKP